MYSGCLTFGLAISCLWLDNSVDDTTTTTLSVSASMAYSFNLYDFQVYDHAYNNIGHAILVSTLSCLPVTTADASEQPGMDLISDHDPLH